MTGLRAEREFGDPAQVTVFVGVQSTYPTAQTVDVQLLINGRVAAVKEAVLPPPAPTPENVRAAPTRTGQSALRK